MESDSIDMFVETMYRNCPTTIASQFNRFQRQLFATAISSLILEHRGSLINGYETTEGFTNSYTEIVTNSINESGICIIPNFIGQEDCKKIVDIIKQIKYGYASHVPSASDFKEISTEAADALKAKHFSFPVPIILTLCPSLVLVLFSKLVLSVAMRYLGCPPTLYSINIFESRSGNGLAPGVTTPHRDYDDFKFLACFLYLTDVSESNGAFLFWPTSHNSDNHETIKPSMATGKAGTLVLCDTWGRHMGLPPIDNNRIAIWWRFGLGKNFAYWWDKNFLLKLGNTISSRIESDLHQYVFRALM